MQRESKEGKLLQNLKKKNEKMKEKMKEKYTHFTITSPSSGEKKRKRKNE